MWCVLFGNIPMGLLLGYFVLGGAAAQNVGVLPAVLYALVAYNALGYCYFHTYNMSETGRRVRILYELYRSGGLGAPEIASLYDVEDMLAVRIERLLSMGQVKVQNGRYVLDGLMLYYAARIMAFWGELIGSPQLKSFAKKTE
jgi:hypothetical protein